jgi:integrase
VPWHRPRSAGYTYLSSMFTLAVRDRMMAASPCDAGIRLPPVARGTRVIPSPEQVHRLAELLPQRLSATVYLAAGCGLRLGEILGLEAGDVDLGSREVHVRRQLKVLKGPSAVPGAGQDQGQCADDRGARRRRGGVDTAPGARR